MVHEIYHVRKTAGAVTKAKVFPFSNGLEGFQDFQAYLKRYQAIASAEQVIVGCEPTGHYWFNLARNLNARHIPRKTDLKGPETIAKLVLDGRYSYPYLSKGRYADLREAV